MGTIRTFDPELRKEIYDEIRQIAKGVATGTGTEISVEFDVGGFYPVTFNNYELVEKMEQSLIEASSGKFMKSDIPVTGAEDFSYFSQEIPGLYFWLGVNKPGVGLDAANFGDSSEAAGNHSPYFLAEIEKNISLLGQKAKEGKITIEDLQGGTFTISNGGIYGSMLSTPILNPPQSAVLGMHNIVERAIIIEKQIKIRPVMYLALSYDHRIIDGKESVSFLKMIKENLEDPRRLFLDI